MGESEDQIEPVSLARPEEVKEIFKPEKVCFVTAVDYPGWLPGGEESESVVRGTLALNTFRNFLELGTNVVLVHSGRTSKSFLEIYSSP